MRRSAGIDVGGYAEAGGAARSVSPATRPVERATRGLDPDSVSAPTPDHRAAWDSLVEERTRWAYQIHDGLTQVVTAAIFELEWLAGLIQEDPGAAVDALGTTRAELRKALDELRLVIFDLSNGSAPPDPDDPLGSYAREVAGRWHLAANISVAGETRSVPERSMDAAFAIIGESVANAAKHAGAGDVTIRIRVGAGDLAIEVEDAGRGFVRSDADAMTRHFGLPMMRKRVEEAGGAIDIESSPGLGTRVVARLPVGSQGEAL